MAQRGEFEAVKNAVAILRRKKSNGRKQHERDHSPHRRRAPAALCPALACTPAPTTQVAERCVQDDCPPHKTGKCDPVGFLDDVTRNHDINYTYIEKVYQGNDPASSAERNQALWQADKEMLGNMLSYQPTNWLEGQYRDAAIKAFVAKADMSYRPAVDVVSEWNRDLAGIDPKFPALNASESGRAQWSLPSLVHAGATYTSTGMEALSTSGVNTQAALLFNTHINPNTSTHSTLCKGIMTTPKLIETIPIEFLFHNVTQRMPTYLPRRAILMESMLTIWYNQKSNEAGSNGLQR